MQVGNALEKQPKNRCYMIDFMPNLKFLLTAFNGIPECDNEFKVFENRVSAARWVSTLGHLCTSISPSLDHANIAFIILNNLLFKYPIKIDMVEKVYDIICSIPEKLFKAVSDKIDFGYFTLGI